MCVCDGEDVVVLVYEKEDPEWDEDESVSPRNGCDRETGIDRREGREKRESESDAGSDDCIARVCNDARCDDVAEDEFFFFSRAEEAL